LREALALGASHVSLYQLTIERNTPFYNAYRRKEFSIPDQDVAADFYTLTQEIMEAAGLPAYEVSNHAVDEDKRSRHNLAYWRYQDYIGLGPDAHGRLTVDGSKVATREHRAPSVWLERNEAQGTALHDPQTLSADEQYTEALMMGLRLEEGVTLERWSDYITAPRMESAETEGWIKRTDNHIRTTTEGRLRLNALLAYLLDD
jgi:oxygen-independent coproporphyrinogen-3 oxidase